MDELWGVGRWKHEHAQEQDVRLVQSCAVAALSRRSRRRHGPRGPALVTLARRSLVLARRSHLFCSSWSGRTAETIGSKEKFYFGTCPDLGPKCSCLGLAYPTGIVRACRFQRACLGI